MHTSSKFSTLLPFLICLISAGCTQQTAPDASTTDEWLAATNNDTIFVSEFCTRYEATPHTGQGINARESYLRALIVERLLADLSRSEELDTLHFPALLAEQLEKETVVEAYLEGEIDANIIIPESEYQEAFRRRCHTLWLDAWVFADSSEAAVAYSRHFMSGTPFERLADSTRTRFIRNHSFTFNESTEWFENVVYKLKPGDLSRPVYGDGAWWLVQMNRSDVDQSLVKAGIESERTYLDKVLRKRHAEDMQPQIINRAMRGCSIAIDPAGFRWLSEIVQRWADVQTEDPNQPSLVVTANSHYLHELQNKDNLDLPIVTFTGFKTNQWTRHDLLEKLATAPRSLGITSAAETQRALHRQIFYLAEIERLGELGLDAGLLQNTAVRREAAMWTNHVHAQTGLTRLAKITGEKLRIHHPEELDDEAGYARADEVMLNWLSTRAEKNNLRVKHSLLASLNLLDTPVIARKTHFPARPAAPMPVGYRWAVLWTLPADTIVP